jgi:putative nucleotidyltransferase with HDIG domain
VEIRPPDTVLSVLGELWAAGHAAYVVGGSLRDVLLGREPIDWDLATSARPEAVQAVFPGAAYENRFGTVGVPAGDRTLEVTTFRSDHDYADFRRPHRVEFGDTIEVDLARRDFTVNAMAWGALAAATGTGAVPKPDLVDPHGGIADLGRRTLRAVGDPGVRFREDALRMLRAVRLAATLDFSVEGATLSAIQANAPLAAHLSGERIGAEMGKLLAAPRPSVGLDLLAATGLLAVVSPELAAQRGIPQNKIPGDDLWDHTIRTVDAVEPARSTVRLAALLHDIGKPATMADGHFHGHDAAGAELARAFLDRVRTPHAEADRVVHLVRNHMFTYDPTWGDAGVRRFIRRIGRQDLDALFALREADNVGSGLKPEAHGLAELRSRVADQLAGSVVLERGDLVVDGDDLMTELGIPPGPALGRLLDDLLERAIADPSINERSTLLDVARSLAASSG